VIFNLNKKIVLKGILLIFLIILPFSLSDITDDITPQKITSDLRFYEINTCSISLNEFLVKNPNVIYQDHYKIRYNNFSSMKCFGQITGIDQIDNIFYISIGTNSILNMFIQSVFWFIILSFIPVNRFQKLKITDFISIISTGLIVITLIYSEKRFYQNAFFELELTDRTSFLHLFIYLLTIIYFGFQIIASRSNQIINYIPYGFLLIGVFSGFNLYFLTLFLCSFGIKTFINNIKIRKSFSIINILILFWSYSALGMFYYLKPDKVRGLSHGDYNFLSVLSWSYLIIFSILGLYTFIANNHSDINWIQLRNSFLNSASILIILGYLGSSMPYVNFINYYFFGLNKYGTDNQNLFSTDIWGENLAWRGFFPSAETVGEFFALGLLIVFLYRKTKLNIHLFMGVVASLIGLYASNNKAALIGLVLCIILKFKKERDFNIQKSLILFFPVIILLLYFIRIENIMYSLDFTSGKMIGMAQAYALDYNLSSSVIFFSEIENKNIFIRSFFLVFGLIAFLINRSELWGIFFARYNPSISELLFGTGPFVLSNHYSEIDIFSKRVSTGSDLGFLLPHSSLLLLLIFTGLIGVIIILALIIFLLLKVKSLDYNLYLIGFFICLNLLKSDSILYYPSMTLYFLFFVLINKKISKT